MNVTAFSRRGRLCGFLYGFASMRHSYQYVKKLNPDQNADAYTHDSVRVLSCVLYEIIHEKTKCVIVTHIEGTAS